MPRPLTMSERYPNRCPMCTETCNLQREHMGFCAACFTVTAQDAFDVGCDVRTYAMRLWDNYNTIYGYDSSQQLNDFMRECLGSCCGGPYTLPPHVHNWYVEQTAKQLASFQLTQQPMARSHSDPQLKRVRFCLDNMP